MKQFSLEMLTILALVGVFLANSAESAKVFSSGVVDLYFEESPVEYDFELRRDNVVKMTGIFGKGVDFTNTSPNFNVTIMSVDDGFRVDWRSSDPNFPSTDCLNLQSETLHWYGGPEIYEQKWPIEKLRLSGDDAYVARKDDNFAGTTCFGSREFIPDKFGNIKNVVEDLQEQGFRVTLWAAPFINPDCTELILEGEEKGSLVSSTFADRSCYGYFVQNTIGNMTTVWWESNDARQIDFTNPEASEWYSQKLRIILQEIGVDGFKFDADDGLQSLVTTLLQLNMIGYSFVLPDMIGGNAYRAQPDLELVIRWTQATVFMPSMQFSFLPWDFEDDEQLKGTEIIRSMVELHTKYAPNIIAAMEEKLINRTPTNPPIWWIVPFDETALGISDEFLLGEDILVAPVMEQGATSRDVYLPEGSWVDGNDPAVKYEGPIWLDYNAPLDVLPYFIKETPRTTCRSSKPTFIPEKQYSIVESHTPTESTLAALILGLLSASSISSRFSMDRSIMRLLAEKFQNKTKNKLVWLWVCEAGAGVATMLTGTPLKSVIQYYRFFRGICSWKLLQDDQLFGGPGHQIQIDVSIVNKRKYHVGQLSTPEMGPGDV
ncbi:hypothetical protein HUJ04_010760 [Dendroctonus ponderosae]|nr:hypothetical protein HUJ04_010760 [Dendroctonus ponderosae]